MTSDPSPFEVRLAKNEADILAAQRLRYEVFVSELGGNGDLVDHENRFERDEFDPHFEHLILIDKRRDRSALQHVVGVYRVMQGEEAEKLGRFYTDDEFELAPLRASGRTLLELGRSCLHADFRGGNAMHLLWNGLAKYIAAHEIEVLFGVASFHGTDIKPLAEPLSFLHHRHLAPPELRVRSKAFQPMDLMAEEQINRLRASKAIPALVKAYLRLGGFVGEGAFIDWSFNTVDVCLVMDTDRISERQRRIYAKARAT